MSEQTELEPQALQRMPPAESQALVVRQPQEVGLFGTNEPVAVVAKATAVANALKAVIVSKGLVSKISGKEYPRCEAWTLLGTMLGVFPVTVWTKPVEHGWEARVEARTKDGSLIGAAEAQCLHSEKNWGNRDDFALRSMAQTRATAKCLRMPLGFVMTLAGYEATPSEEMDERQPPRHEPPPARQLRSANPKPAAKRVPTAKTREWAFGKLVANGGEALRLVEFLQQAGAMMPNQKDLAEWPLQYVPASEDELKALKKALAAFENGEPAKVPFYHEEAIEGAAPKTATLVLVTDPKAKPIEVPRDPDAGEQGDSEVADINPSWEKITGKVERVSVKQGTNRRGPWTCFGIKIGEDWYNSFSKRVGQLAQLSEGREVDLYYSANDKGKTAEHIEV